MVINNIDDLDMNPNMKSNMDEYSLSRYFQGLDISVPITYVDTLSYLQCTVLMHTVCVYRTYLQKVYREQYYLSSIGLTNRKESTYLPT